MSRNRKKNRGSNRLGVFSISFIVIILLICLAVQSRELKAKIQVYENQKVTLQHQKEYESERAKEIEEMEEYKTTKEYVEQVAKDKLGLVYKDEIIFKPSNP